MQKLQGGTHAKELHRRAVKPVVARKRNYHSGEARLPLAGHAPSRWPPPRLRSQRVLPGWRHPAPPCLWR